MSTGGETCTPHDQGQSNMCANVNESKPFRTDPVHQPAGARHLDCQPTELRRVAVAAGRQRLLLRHLHPDRRHRHHVRGVDSGLHWRPDGAPSRSARLHWLAGARLCGVHGWCGRAAGLQYAELVVAADFEAVADVADLTLGVPGAGERAEIDPGECECETWSIFVMLGG